MEQVLEKLKSQASNLETVRKFMAQAGTARVAAAEGDVAAKKAATDVLGAVVPLDSAGKPTNAIDAQVAAIITSKRSEVTRGIAAATKNGVLNPLDAYDVYYKVLSDSGALSVMLLAPAQVRKLDSMRAQGSCSVCSACSACSACSVCSISVVEGTIATGVVGATAATFG